MSLKRGKNGLPIFSKHATEGRVLNGQRSVLIVDQSEETREVLQTALERRGVRTLAAGRAEKGLELARQHQPDLVVLDLEIDDMPADGFSVSSSERTPKRRYEPQLILLGSLRRQGNHLPGGEFVAKPYHYGLLIRRIEELLESTRESVSCRRCSSSAESTKGVGLN
jgi:DNA-binding response OmpR family regulator